MAAGDVSHKFFLEICELCRTYSRNRVKAGKNIIRYPFSRISKVVDSNGVTRVELENLLENSKLTSYAPLVLNLMLLKLNRDKRKRTLL